MKFINLLKKELSELINGQMILGLVVTMVMLMFVGNVMEDTISSAVTNSATVNISDRDNTEFTQALIETMKTSGAKVNIFATEGDDYAKIIRDNKIENIIIIPEGFSDTLLIDKTKPEIISISAMSSAAAMSNLTNDNTLAVDLLSSCIKSALAANAGVDAEELALMDSPVSLSSKTVIDDKAASISVQAITNKVMMQNMILPIVVFILIMMTSQMLISAISNEKIDKTLETLLSAPVSRTSVLGAKMLAAATVALLNAAAYMFGFSFFVTGATTSATKDIAASAVGEFISVETALVQLGLALSPLDYILIGLQLFLTIMICLSVSLILGAMVNDTKSSQTMIMPILMLAMVPYLISMVADINKLPALLRVIVYLIPFTHTFSAMPNLMFGNTAIFFGGLAYQAVFFLICMIVALKIFKSDKIFTISLNFGQKSKYRKSVKTNED